jgi:methoxymalonate biosynthesis protein
MIKCIVWDLDGTLWDGTLRDNPDVSLRDEAKTLLEEADRAGVIHSIASRNDSGETQKKLRSLGVEQYFLYPQISVGESKVTSLRRIAERFGIGLDSVCFVDDNPFELYEVSRYLPEVMTCEASRLDWIRAELSAQAGIVPATNHRALMAAREARLCAEEAFNGTREEFLEECHMVLRVRAARAEDLDRVWELVMRTNQLNNLRARWGREVLEEYQSDANKLFCICELDDRFGRHGIVGAALFRMEGAALTLELFCISCRTEGQGVAAAFLGEAVETVFSLNPQAEKLICFYRTSERSRAAFFLLKTLGFDAVEKKDGQIRMELAAPFQKQPPKWIEIIREETE